MKLTILILLIFSFTLAKSQDTLQTEPVEEGFRIRHNFGLQAGLNAGTISYSPPRAIGYENGFAAGFMYRRIGRPGLGVQLELNLVNKGYLVEGSEENLVADTVYNFNMVEVPFMAHGYLGRKNGKLFLNLGCFVNMRLGGRFSYDDLNGNRSQETVNMERVQRFGIGIVGGVGYGRKIGPGFAQVSLRYQFSLGNLYEQVILQSDFTQMQAITVNMGFLF